MSFCAFRVFAFFSLFLCIFVFLCLWFCVRITRQHISLQRNVGKQPVHKKILTDGKNSWARGKKVVLRRKLFLGEKEGGGERCAIRKASVTDSRLILDTSFPPMYTSKKFVWVFHIFVFCVSMFVFFCDPVFVIKDFSQRIELQRRECMLWKYCRFIM